MYQWRAMTAEQRAEVLRDRIVHQRPWHSPPHFDSGPNCYMITAACYEHAPIIGLTPQRIANFEIDLLETAHSSSESIFAWALLPNHYHLLVHCQSAKILLRALGRLHGRMSFTWNGENNRRGRTVWCNAAETVMKSERHFWATFLYILHNPVKHGYVKHWQDWPYSNARLYLEEHGREAALQLWREYPIDDYGNDWDPADL